MTLHIDKDTHTLYLHLNESATLESEEISPGVVVDYNESSEVVAIEILNLSQRSYDGKRGSGAGAGGTGRDRLSPSWGDGRCRAERDLYYFSLMMPCSLQIIPARST